jgi:hypothetical protein
VRVIKLIRLFPIRTSPARYLIALTPALSLTGEGEVGGYSPSVRRMR